jgi:hypothetical protein
MPPRWDLGYLGTYAADRQPKPSVIGWLLLFVTLNGNERGGKHLSRVLRSRPALVLRAALGLEVMLNSHKIQPHPNWSGG